MTTKSQTIKSRLKFRFHVERDKEIEGCLALSLVAAYVAMRTLQFIPLKNSGASSTKIMHIHELMVSDLEELVDFTETTCKLIVWRQMKPNQREQRVGLFLDKRKWVSKWRRASNIIFTRP